MVQICNVLGNAFNSECIIHYALWCFDHNVLCLNAITLSLDTTHHLAVVFSLIFNFYLDSIIFSMFSVPLILWQDGGLLNK